MRERFTPFVILAPTSSTCVNYVIDKLVLLGGLFNATLSCLDSIELTY